VGLNIPTDGTRSYRGVGGKKPHICSTGIVSMQKGEDDVIRSFPYMEIKQIGGCGIQRSQDFQDFQDGLE